MSTDTPLPARAGTPTVTPRTDNALIEKILCTEGGDEECTVYPNEEIVSADFARQLEQELSALTSANAALAGENKELRIMCAVCHTEMKSFYCDDGELQDTRAHPWIDWKRDSVVKIQTKLAQRVTNLLALPPTDGAHAGAKI